MKLLLIHNPRSGRAARTARLAPILQQFMASQPPDAKLAFTQAPGHATALARQAVEAGVTRVVCVGGDGTMNEVAQALTGTSTELGLVPCGSGNGLARHLRLPAGFQQALTFACDPQAPVSEIDAATVNGRPFFNAMGFGLDAEVSHRFNQLTRRGLPAYARTALGAFFGQRPQRCRITADGRTEWVDAILVAVANSDQYGNNARIAPGARVDDGILDLVAVRPVGAAGAAVLAARLFLGSFDRSPRVLRLRGQSFLMERPGPGLIHTDGEPYIENESLGVRLASGSLRVVTAPSFQAARPLGPISKGPR